MKVTLYKSTDGLLHESHKSFTKHEVELRVLAAAGAITFDLKDFVQDDRNDDILLSEHIPNFIASNAAALRKLLNDALVAKRPRKAKAPKRVPTWNSDAASAQAAA